MDIELKKLVSTKNGGVVYQVITELNDDWRKHIITSFTNPFNRDGLYLDNYKSTKKFMDDHGFELKIVCEENIKKPLRIYYKAENGLFQPDFPTTIENSKPILNNQKQ
jgi:hypothetical protein